MKLPSYNIVDFGAESSDRLQTKAIQTAIDTCFSAGGGEVVIPEGFFLTGGIRLRSNVTLHLLSGAVLEGSRNPEDYSSFEDDTIEPPKNIHGSNVGQYGSTNRNSRWNHGLIKAFDAHNIAIIGEPYSCINGMNCFDELGEEHYRGPHGINCWDCDGITLRGYTIRHTANWAHALFYCKNIDIEKVSAYAGHDGYDIYFCENVNIHNCTANTGDDCFAGFGSRNVRVSDCILNSACSAIRFGGTDVVIENCSSDESPYAFRGSLSLGRKAAGEYTTVENRHTLKTAYLYYCHEGFGKLPYEPGNIIIRNCDFKNCWSLFNMAYGTHKWCCGSPLRSIRFENCTLTGATYPVFIHGDPEAKIDFTLENVTLAPAADGEQSAFMDAENASSITLKNVNLEAFTNPKLILRSETTVTAENVTAFETIVGEAGKSGIQGH